mgnify:CR=1 FL=1
MARISTYQQDTNISTGDKLLGTDSGGGTKNFVISNLSSFLSESNTSGTSSSFTFKYKQSNRGQGDMHFVFSGASTFANVTAIKVSKYNYNSQNVIDKALELLNAKKIIIYDVNNRNNYGVFDAESVIVDSNNSNFYDLSLAKTKSNGAISDTTIYGIDLFAGADVNYKHHQNSASTTWSINHNLGKFPSVSIKFSSSDQIYSNVGAFAGVIYTDENNLTINLAAAESGYAYLN